MEIATSTAKSSKKLISKALNEIGHEWENHLSLKKPPKPLFDASVNSYRSLAKTGFS